MFLTLFNMWYLYDGTLAGPNDAVKHAIHHIQQFGPSLELYINMTKCELFSRGDIVGFPADIKVFHEPNFEILGAPIGMQYFVPNSSLKREPRQSNCCPRCQRWVH